LYWTKEDRTAADLIVAVDGEEVETADDFLGLVERKKPGETVVVKVIRGTQTIDVPVVLAGPSIDQPAVTTQPPL
jgi:S1-C subfamily serine protease